MSKLSFSKMHGLGNDFVVLDATGAPIELSAEQVRAIADRRFGVGCDQILIVDAPPRAGIDFGYRIYNADGSEVGQCGNGARCLASFVQRNKLSEKRSLRIATSTTELDVEVLDDGWVRVHFSPPELLPANIPLSRDEQALRYELALPGETIAGGAVSMGNPHFVVQVEDTQRAEVERLGAALSTHADFPEGVNVGFMQVVDRQNLRLRVYERGAAETLACGSGACAALVAARLWQSVDEQVMIELPGGPLRIAWAGPGEPVLMEGAATWVFDGEMYI